LRERDSLAPASGCDANVASVRLVRATLVNIRRGQLKCVAHKFDLWLAISADHNFDDVEPDENIGIIEQLKPGERAASDEFLFGRINRVNWPPEILTRSRFYFYENERVIISTNDIDFAAASATEIPGKNFATFAPEKRAGQFLSASAETKMLGRLRRMQKMRAPIVGK
jgi:hypothetical protein